MFQTNLYVKSKPTCQVEDIFFEYRAVYEIMWKNMVEPGRPPMTKWRMHAGYVRLQTHSEYIIIAFPLLRWLHERVSVLLYTYLVCLVGNCKQ